MIPGGFRVPIDHTEPAAVTGSSRRAFLARTAAGGAVAASVGAIGLGGVLPVMAQEGDQAPTAISATTLATADFAAFAAPLELAAAQAYLAAITNGRSELSEEWLDTLAQFLRHHQEVGTLLVSLVDADAEVPAADPGVTAQFTPPLGADQNGILVRLAELEEGIAATHLAVVGDLEDTVIAKTVIQVSAVEQQQAVALGRAAGTAIDDLTPAVGSTEGGLTPGGTPATPFGGTGAEPAAGSTGSTTTTATGSTTGPTTTTAAN
jgi:hypothetical protein